MILIQLIIYLLARSTARSHSTELCMQYMRTIVCASCECVPFCVAAHGGRFVGVRALISFAIKPFGVPWLKSPIYQYKLTQLMDEIHSWCCRHRWQTECECTVRQTGVKNAHLLLHHTIGRIQCLLQNFNWFNLSNLPVSAPIGVIYILFHSIFMVTSNYKFDSYDLSALTPPQRIILAFVILKLNQIWKYLNFLRARYADRASNLLNQPYRSYL